MSKRIKALHTDAKSGQAAFTLLVGWALGTYLSDPVGIAAIIGLSLVFGLVCYDYIGKHFIEIYPELADQDDTQ